ncbi:MAG TPA: efflux transporter outer membrane subunit [Desulfobacteraceae bacterium]|nr:efflux transporter outer membrane subunit [Desulfobacteraceae bacterium]HPJ67174.1 efflux transporter outer membrane subunit [Desulfobacteraceae bacterium]HPQ26834.1 efflux transporter outer membrane subunit [Desulfobacteraceae bacterium]
MTRYSIYLLIGIILFVSSCSLAPKYEQPKAPIPAQWPRGQAYGEMQDTAGKSSVSDLKRYSFFCDEKLLKIIEISLNNNRDLRLAALNVERARALYGVQRAELFPPVGVTGSGSKQRSSSDFTKPGEQRTTKKYSVDLGITSWEIDFFGRIRNLGEQALQEYLATEQAWRSAEIALVSGISRAYMLLAADRENLRLSRSTLDTQQEIHDLIRRQYEAGLANELDLHRAQTQVEAARGDVARFVQLVAQDQNALNLLAGSTVPEELLPDDLESIGSPKDISPGLSSEVLLNRPDIIAAEHQLKAAYAFIGAARAAFFPRISLTTAIGTSSDELSGLFKSGTGTWSFAPQISMPIFDARTWAALRVSKTAREIALTQYEKVIQTAFREVSDSLAIQGTVEDQLKAQKSLVNALAETCRLSIKRYNNGIDSYLGVLDAQRSLYSAQHGLIALRLSRIINRINLYSVLGGGSE